MEASLALINGKVHTMDQGECEAVAVQDNTIIKTGENDKVMKTVTPQTRIIDMKGRALLPGFIDTHAHLLGYGVSLSTVDLRHVESVEELILRCKQYIQCQYLPPGQWLLGRGWNQNVFCQDKRFPDRRDLDRISRDHPILLLRVCGHIGVANSMAMAEVGIDSSTYVSGGSFDLDEAGKPNGVIREASLEWFKKNRKTESDRQLIRKGISEGAEELLQYGVTSVHSEDSYDLGYSGHFREIMEAYLELEKTEHLPLRVYQKISLPGEEDIRSFLSGKIRTGDGSDFYRIGPVKQWCDGTVGARTAALREPYQDDPGNRGILVYSRDELLRNATLAHQENMQICLHAIGDAALEMVIDVYEEILKHSSGERRHRIVHCQIGDPSLYKRLAPLNVSLNIQAAQTATDWPMMRERLGPQREAYCHHWRNLTDLGVKLTGGSDIPVEEPDVLYGIYAAVNRMDRRGKPEGGWIPEQKLTVREALETYTIHAAHSAFEEDRKGSITSGKLADFVLLGQDPFQVPHEQLKDITVDMTIVDGEVKWERELGSKGC